MFVLSVQRVLLLISLLWFTTALAASAARSDKLSRGDENFVKEAAQGGMMEVELGKLAMEKASSETVKDFGKRM